MRKILILSLLIACFSCSQNMRSRNYVYKAMREEVLFETFAYSYIHPKSTVSRSVPGTIKISRSNFFFQSYNPSINKVDVTDFIIPIAQIKNVVILEKMKNEQITFRFNLGKTNTILLSSEKSLECIDLIKSLQKQ